MIGVSGTINSLETESNDTEAESPWLHRKTKPYENSPWIRKEGMCLEHVLSAVTTAIFQIGKIPHKTPLFLEKQSTKNPNWNSCWKRTVERKHLEEMPFQFQSCLQYTITYIFQDVILCFIRQHHNEIIPLNMDSRSPVWSMVIIMSDSASWESILKIFLINRLFLWCRHEILDMHQTIAAQTPNLCEDGSKHLKTGATPEISRELQGKSKTNHT